MLYELNAHFQALGNVGVDPLKVNSAILFHPDSHTWLRQNLRKGSPIMPSNTNMAS